MGIKFRCKEVDVNKERCEEVIELKPEKGIPSTFKTTVSRANFPKLNCPKGHIHDYVYPDDAEQ